MAAWLLALIGGGALFVSFSAQYAYILTVRRQDAASVIEALLLDVLMIVFTLLALGLSRAGKSSRAERVLILACAAASSYMNMSAADVASPRLVAAYAIAPIALAVVVDRVVAVIRRHVRACQIFCVSWGSRCPFVMLVGSFSVPGQTGTRSPNATANAFMAAFQP